MQERYHEYILRKLRETRDEDIMPTYNFRNKETGEEIEVLMKISELDEYKANNPHMEQFLKKPPLLARESRDIISRTPDGFNDVLKSIKKGSGRNTTIHTKN